MSTDKRSRRLFFTGFSMGLADLVPGVSGGTVALLYGIYDELLYSVRQATGTALRLLLKGKIKDAFGVIPFKFLVPLGLGMLTAILGLVHVITYLLEKHPVMVWSLFFGLVVGAAYVVYRRVEGWNTNRYVLLMVGFVLTYLIVGLPSLEVASSPSVMFLTGAIAICAMILPGISGSLIMVILGQYKNVIDAVANRDIVLLLSFGLGAALGLALFARFLSWLLHEHHNGTMALLIGAMLGSLRKVWPWQSELDGQNFANVLPELNVMVLLALLLAAGGFLLVMKLEKLGVAKEHDDIKTKDFIREVQTQHD